VLLNSPNIKSSPFSSSRVWAVALWITALTLFIYLPALHNDFVNWDDDKYVYENENILSLDLKLLKWSFGFHLLNWHPLTLISHSIDYALWGLNPIGHHLISIVLHGSNTFLLYILILYLLTDIRLYKSSFYETDNKTIIKNIIVALVAALLFGIHPIHTESVAWVSERKDVLSTFFVLLSLISYRKYVAIQKTKKKSFYYILSLIFFILALMSKPMAATLPIVLIILDIYPFQRFSFEKVFKAHKKVIMEKIPFFFFSLIVTTLTIIAQYSGGAIVSLKSYPLPFRIAVAIKGLSFYLEKMVFPIGLSPFYPLPKSISFLSFEYIFPIILIILISILCVWTWKRGRKVFAVVWAYYIVTLLPVIGIIQLGGQAAADRYSYIPSIGPFFLIGLGISLVWEKYCFKERVSSFTKIIIFLILISILSLLGMQTLKQLRIWNNSITLWSYELNKYPDLWLAYYNRAHAYTSLGDYQRALKDLDKAIQYKPKYAQAYYVRAINYIGLGDYQQALKDLDTTIKFDPQSTQTYHIRANVYAKMENHHEALRDLDKVIEIDHNNFTAYNDRGLSYFALGKLKEAIADYSKAITLNPGYSVYYYNRGTAYFKIGENAEAIRDFQIAARLGNKKTREFLTTKGMEW
jgi:tetratricopeptide (TPR) repeat protein